MLEDIDLLQSLLDMNDLDKAKLCMKLLGGITKRSDNDIGTGYSLHNSIVNVKELVDRLEYEDKGYV